MRTNIEAEKIEEYSIAQLTDYYGTDKENDVIGKKIKVRGRVKSIEDAVVPSQASIRSFLLGDDEGHHLIANASISSAGAYAGHVLHTQNDDKVVMDITYEGFLTGRINSLDNKTLIGRLTGEMHGD